MALSSLRVLVVDDDFLARSYAKHVLDVAGYDVVGAGSGLEALQVVKQPPTFDLFVLDVVMPQMSGTELARHIRQSSPDAKILYVTGHSDQLFTDRGALWEHEAFIGKPVSPEALREAVSLLLHGTFKNPPAAA